MRDALILWFDEIGLDDVPRVGGKNASLGELLKGLSQVGVKVPGGFAVTAHGFRLFISEAGLAPKLERLLAGASKKNLADLARRGATLRALVLEAPLPEALAQGIRAAYRRLEERYGANTDVAVRSSATAEDLPTASFAGQHESYLNVAGADALVTRVRQCFASLFTDRAIAYRIDHGFDHMKVALSVGVQKMVRADEASSGVIFTLDTESGFRDVVYVTAVHGLGETIVQGLADPDEFYVHKPTFTQGFRVVLRRRLGRKQWRMVYGQGRQRATRLVRTRKEARQRFSISDEEVLTLADYAIRVEAHYSARAGHAMPMDLEWAKDGETGTLYIIQARPETVRSQERQSKLADYRLGEKGVVVARGRAVGTGIAAGPVMAVADKKELAQFRDGAVLVTQTTAPDWEPVLKRAAAIVTERGGRTCHAAIVARELGIPAVVGVAEARARLLPLKEVTVSCAEGEEGRIYEGLLAFTRTGVNLERLPSTQTAMMLNLGNPDQAFHLSALPAAGVGLARIEFIISEAVRAHPMALIHPEKVTGNGTRAALARLVAGYEDGRAFFIEKLSEGVATIAAAFYPRPVIVRTSDFKSNEYAALLGGRDFEAVEANPMIGFRGAARYAHPAYAEGFALECAALRRVREVMGLGNVKVMVPFCRRVGEAQATLRAMARHGLVRGKNGLEVYMMCEIPSNVVSLEAFARHFDGFSIGSNDLTQLVLGVDRDSDIVAFDFDERDPAVLAMIAQAIASARRCGKPCGICGQAPSDYAEIAAFLVEEGITSISLNPDSLIKTIRTVARMEKRRGKRPRKGSR